MPETKQQLYLKECIRGIIQNLLMKKASVHTDKAEHILRKPWANYSGGQEIIPRIAFELWTITSMKAFLFMFPERTEAKTY